MPDYLIELLFWVAIFVGLFVVLRRMQSKKAGTDTKQKTDKDHT